jgi:YVTN family beta-propeller protein
VNIHGKRTSSRRPAALLAGLVPALLCLVGWVPAGQPAPVPQDAAPKAYVALHDESALAVLDTTANRVMRFIPVPLGPHGLAMTPDGRKVYVGSDQLSTVSVLDTATDGLLARIEVGLYPYGLSVSPDGRRLLVSVWGANEVVIIDTTTDRITGRVSVPRPDRSAISPDGRIAYVGSTSPDEPALVVVDLTRSVKVGTIPLSHVPRALAFSSDWKRLYFTIDDMDALQVLDPGRNKIVAAVPAGAAPHGLIFTASPYGPLVVSRSRNELEILDPLRNIISGTVAVGRLPHGIATGADERTVYVTDEGSGDVSVVDLVDRKVTATITIDTIGGTPREIVVQPRSNASSTHSVTLRGSRSAGHVRPSRILAASMSYAGNGYDYGPVLEIRRDAENHQDSATGPGYTSLPSSPPSGYDSGFAATVPHQPLWVVQLHF